MPVIPVNARVISVGKPALCAVLPGWSFSPILADRWDKCHREPCAVTGPDEVSRGWA